MPHITLPVDRGSQETVSPVTASTRQDLHYNLEEGSSSKARSTAMAPSTMVAPAYNGPTALGFSRYASSDQKAQLATASDSFGAAPSTPKTTIATKEQIAATEPELQLAKATTPTTELAVEQDTVLKKQVMEHSLKFSRAISSAITNTHQLLRLLREATPGSETVEDLWKELEQLFEAANDAKAALPTFMEKQRDNMSLYHSSMMNETIRETQDELNLQHKKVNTQYGLILEQQDAFALYKAQTASKLSELESLQERVSRLTLEKGNFRTEVDKYKMLLEQEIARKSEVIRAVVGGQKELETLVSSKKQLQVENDTLRKSSADMLKKAEQKVTDRLTKELEAKDEELRKERVKAGLLHTVVNDLKNGESTTKKELDKIKGENRLLSTKYHNQTTEYAAAFKNQEEQKKRIEELTADVDRLQKQNAELQAKSDRASELAKANTEISKAKADLAEQVVSLSAQLINAKDDAKAMQSDMQKLKATLGAKDAAPAVGNNKALLEKIKGLEEKKDSLETSLAEWTELAKRSYNEYKEMLPMYKAAERHREDALEKASMIDDLKRQLAAAKASQTNGTSASGDAAYWKQKYETLLSTIG